MVAKLLADVGPCDDDARLFINGNRVLSVGLNQVRRFQRDLPDGDYNFRFQVINTGGHAWKAKLRLLINGQELITVDDTGDSLFYTGPVFEDEWQARITNADVSEFGTPARAMAAPPTTEAKTDADFGAVVQALGEYYPGAVDEDFMSHVAAANSSAALAVMFGQWNHASAPDLAIQQARQEAPVGGDPAAALGGTTVRSYWWGMHVEISHKDLETILNSADMINDLVVAIGGDIPSPARPWIKLIGPYVSLVHDKLREQDQGYGIYISMSWFAPGLFVPTPVQGPEYAPEQAPERAEQHAAERAKEHAPERGLLRK